MKEQQLGMTGMINQETAAKVGELLGVKAIISGWSSRSAIPIEVNARLISVEDGSILNAERIRGSAWIVSNTDDGRAGRFYKERFSSRGVL